MLGGTGLAFASRFPMMSTDRPPVVSVVMATYNRSNIIGYAIRSLLRSDFSDWELIVVGDACTDDTEDVVRSFGDPRIRFHSMPVNFGEQSGPNNVGGTLARGRYVAYLNHDDFYFPDHLSTAVARLDKGDVDLLYGMGVRIDPPGSPRLVGAVTRDGAYSAVAETPASLWVLRRDLLERAGPWPRASDVRAASSRTWLHQVFRSGFRVAASPHLAALILTSGNRHRAYAERADAEHRHWFARLTSPDFPTPELVSACLHWEEQRYHLKARPFLIEGVKIAVRSTLTAMGVFPPVLNHLVRFWKRGAYIRYLRTARGLPAKPDETIDNPHQGESVR